MSATRCLICGMLTLSDAASYKSHMDDFHSFGHKEKVKPVRTTDRTKSQIVEDMENGVLAPFVVQLGPKPGIVLRDVAKIPTIYCGRGGEVCVWEVNGWDICAPCARKREAEKAAQNLESSKGVV